MSAWSVSNGENYGLCQQLDGPRVEGHARNMPIVSPEALAYDAIVVSPTPKTTVTVRLSLQAHDGVSPKVATVFSSSKTSTLHGDPRQMPPLHHSPIDASKSADGCGVYPRGIFDRFSACFSIVFLRAGTRLLRHGLPKNNEELWVRWLIAEVPCTVMTDRPTRARPSPS